MNDNKLLDCETFKKAYPKKYDWVREAITSIAMIALFCGVYYL